MGLAVQTQVKKGFIYKTGSELNGLRLRGTMADFHFLSFQVQ
jgi:hypothetical protein